jgi:hypothetical protein
VKDLAQASLDMEADCRTRIEKVIEVLHYLKAACFDMIQDSNQMFLLANHPHHIWIIKSLYKENPACEAKILEGFKEKAEKLDQLEKPQDSSQDSSHQPLLNVAATFQASQNIASSQCSLRPYRNR